MTNKTLGEIIECIEDGFKLDCDDLKHAVSALNHLLVLDWTAFQDLAKAEESGRKPILTASAVWQQKWYFERVHNALKTPPKNGMGIGKWQNGKMVGRGGPMMYEADQGVFVRPGENVILFPTLEPGLSVFAVRFTNVPGPPEPARRMALDGPIHNLAILGAYFRAEKWQWITLSQVVKDVLLDLFERGEHKHDTDVWYSFTIREDA